jgi:hypothetical protein
MMSDDILVEFGKAYRGCVCTIQRREHDWVFRFGDSDGITVTAPWRIIQGGRIAHAREDDGQRFGLPQPVDGEARANGLLEGRWVEYIELDRVTADLRLHFDGQTRIDIFNDSSGYEGWQAGFRTDSDAVLIIGMGGGDVSIFRQPKPMQKS